MRIDGVAIVDNINHLMDLRRSCKHGYHLDCQKSDGSDSPLSCLAFNFIGLAGFLFWRPQTGDSTQSGYHQAGLKDYFCHLCMSIKMLSIIVVRMSFEQY